MAFYIWLKVKFELLMISMISLPGEADLLSSEIVADVGFVTETEIKKYYFSS